MSHTVKTQIQDILDSIEVTSFDDALSFEYWTAVQKGKLPVPEFLDDSDSYDDDAVF